MYKKKDKLSHNNLWLQRLEHLPIVDINDILKASSENLNSIDVFPTPESPIKSNLNK